MCHSPKILLIFISAVLHLMSKKLPGGIDLQFGIEVSLFNLRPLKAKTLTTHYTRAAMC